MKKAIKILSLVLFVLCFVSTPANAGTVGLPSADLFTVDITVSQEMASPVISFANLGVGIFGLWLLVRAVFALIRIAVGLLTGGSREGAMDKLKNLGIGVLLVIVALTGVWYKLVYYLWEKIHPKVTETIGSLPDLTWAVNMKAVAIANHLQGFLWS